MHELEITNSQIARLVLGYLKLENCDAAYEEFLKCSKYLRESRGRILTRVAGLTLVDYLTQYGLLNILIQERLEETDFYNEHHSRTTLVEQLSYLLDHSTTNIRSSTPNRSPILKRVDLSSVAVNTEPDGEEKENKDVNTTPLESLPGSSRSSENKNGKDKSKNSSAVNKEGGEEALEVPTIDVEVLTQTLLEHHELHEKIADTINVVRNTPETSQINVNTSIDKNNTAVQDVEAAIKTIVQKTTSDPYFDRLVKEIIGEEVESSNSEKEPKTTHHVLSGKVDNDNVLPPTKHASVTFSNRTDDQGGGGAQGTWAQIKDTALEDIQKQSAAVNTLTDTARNDVSDNCLDQYLKFNTTKPSMTVDNQGMVLNSNGLLMFHSAPATQYYVINSVTQPVCNTGGVLTEQDIMSMPVVVCDDKPEKQGLNQLLIPSNVNQQVASSYLVTAATEVVSTAVPFCSTEQRKPPIKKSSNSKSSKSKKRKLLPKGSKGARIKVQIPEIVEETANPQQVRVVENKEHAPEIGTFINTVTPSNEEGPKQGAGKGVSTPRSGSHVRALDFSTPQKLFPTSDQTEGASEGTRISPKIRTSDSEETQAKIVAKKESNNGSKPSFGSWDSDLRDLVGIDNKNSPDQRKQKIRKVTSKKQKRKTPKKKKIDTSNNSTHEEAKLIEERLLAGASPDSKVAEQNTSTEAKVKGIVTKNDADEVKQTDFGAEKCAVDDDKSELERASASKPEHLKAADCTDDAVSKLVLSPSKLNASKRTLVDLSDCQPVSKKKVASKNDVPSTSKRNITSMLETPVKMNECPKTPGFFSPVNIHDTPFTKVLKENLCGVDIATIPTPKSPVTPHVPFTPSIDDPCYPNRPTDYSSSSSYYQPSDNENNRSIEQLIEECNRLESGPSALPLEKQIHVLDEVRIPPCDEQLDKAHKAVVEKMKVLSKNVIGCKNLKLVEQDRNTSSSSCSSCCDSSSDESDASTKSNGANETVIAKTDNPTVPQRYSLRIRKINEQKMNAAAFNESSPETITSILSSVSVKSTLESSGVTAKIRQEEILLEMEEKRKRTIQILESEQMKSKTTKKTVSNKLSRKPTPKAQQAMKKVLSTMNENKTPTPKPNKNTTKPGDDVKTNSCEQTKPPETAKPEPVESVLTPNEESQAKLEPANQKGKSSPKIPGDQQAEKLVNDLKERGIHLVHNKSPKTPQRRKLSSDTCSASGAEKPTGVDKALDSSFDRTRANEKGEGIADKPDKNDATEKDNPEGAKLNQNECTENLENNNREIEEVVFDHCRFDRETVRLFYDPWKRNRKKLSDYNFDLLKKSMNAKVYLAEFDMEVEKLMTCTPFESILDIAPRVVWKKKHSAQEKTTKKDMPKIQRCNPLDLLSRRLSEEHTPQSTSSPLENLYDDQKSSYSKNTENPNTQETSHKALAKNILNKSHRAKTKRARSLSSSMEKNKSSSESSAEKRRQSAGTASKEARIRHRRQSEPRLPGKEAANPEKDMPDLLNGSAAPISSANKQSEEDAEDDLMNYAAAGSPDKNSKKRRADDTAEGTHREKKIKTEDCQELLKAIDVETFLKQLHGET